MSPIVQLAEKLPWRSGKVTAELEAASAHLILSIPTFRQSISAVDIELRRSRRYERPLTALLLGAETPELSNRNATRSGDSISPPAPAESPHTLFFLLGALLQDTVREFDIVTYAAEYHLYALFLPEADEVQAYVAALRISDAFCKRTAAHIRAGAATFPRDGLTVRDLLGRAHEAWQDRPVFPHISPMTGDAIHG